MPYQPWSKRRPALARACQRWRRRLIGSAGTCATPRLSPPTPRRYRASWRVRSRSCRLLCRGCWSRLTSSRAPATGCRCAALCTPWLTRVGRRSAPPGIWCGIPTPKASASCWRSCCCAWSSLTPAQLLAFLLLRLVEPDTRATYRWEATSVDVADLPAFFSEYCGKPVGAWTASLSQAAHGDYGSTGTLPLAAWTDEVREALATHRLIVTNHALLLSHVNDLAADADRTLLIVDEAHSREGAATDALSPSLATSEIGETLAGLFTLARDLASAAEVGGLVRSLAELRDWWTDGRLRRHVARTLDRGVGDVSVGSRTMTLASPFSGAQAGSDARIAANLLHSLYGLCGRILGALGKVSETNAGRLDVFDEQRLLA